MGIPLLALMGRQPQILDYGQQQAQAQQIQAMRNQNAMAPGQLQLQQQQIEENKRLMAERQALNDAYKNAIQTDENGQPQIDINGVTKALALGGHGSAVPSIVTGFTEMQKARQSLLEQTQKITEAHADLLGHAGYAIQQAKYDPAVAHAVLSGLGNTPEIQKLHQLADANPQQFKTMVDSAVSSAPFYQKAQTEKEVATIRAPKGPEGEMPLGADKVSQLNQGLARRFQVLNAGKALPAEYTLPANATQKDFDRVDKLLTQTEGAQATAAQQAISNQMRQQTLEIAKQAHADTQAQHAAKPVIAYDSNNQAHLLAEGDAKAAGYTGITEATPKQLDDAKTHNAVLNDMQAKLNDVVAARSALDQGPEQRAIISKVLSHSEPGMVNDTVRAFALKGATPKTKEYIQAVSSLKESSLGMPKELTGGSRVSDIQGNALFQTLPSGASSDSSYALGQAKKFQANIDRLRTRVPEVRGQSAINPHNDLQQAAPSAYTPPAGAKSAIGPNGHRINVDNGKWVDSITGAPI